MQALAKPDCGWFYRANAKSFETLPGNPIAYWASASEIKTFETKEAMSAFAYGCNGITTGKNTHFLRLWFEISCARVSFDVESSTKLNQIDAWVPYNKGGEFRKWAGWFDNVIDWRKGGLLLSDYGHLVMRSKSYMLKQSFTWSKVSSGRISMRRVPEGFMFDVAGLSLFPRKGLDGRIFEAFVNSSVATSFLSFLSPTLNFEVGNIMSLPIAERCLSDGRISQLAQECEFLAESSRDSYEESWQFRRHSLI